MPISDDPRRFEPGEKLLHGNGRELVIESSRVHRNRLLVKFEGVDDRDTAEALRGGLYVSSSQLRSLESDEFWEHDLVGCEVIRVDGISVGHVSRIVPGAAQDLLEVATEHGPRLVPMVKEIVGSVDLDARRVVIDPPEGLID
jgi:16S rRNA processing protein RimM